LNVALSAAVLLILSLPGIIARRVYLSFPFAKRYAVTSIADEIALSVIPALLLQCGMMEAVECLTPYRVDLVLLGDLLTGSARAATAAFANLEQWLIPIAIYNLVLWSLAVFLAWVLRSAVVKYRLDLRFRPLRFTNEWYYFLTGREWDRSPGDIALVMVDAFAVIGNTSFIYSGRLDSYKLGRDGNLDYICLTNTRRWTGPNAFAPVVIPGEALILRYETIANLNISFVKLSETSGAP
jgi:hypothetical protein